MNLAVRVVLVTALFFDINLMVLGEQRDSLFALIQDAKDETGKAMLYLELADSKQNERIDALREAEGLFKSNQNNSVGIETYLRFGKYFRNVNQKDSARFYYEKALNLASIFNDQFYLGRSNQEIADFYKWAGDLNIAYNYGSIARDIFISMRDTFWLLPQLNFLADIEVSRLDFQKAERQYSDVIARGLMPRDKEAIALANLGLGILKINQANYSEAYNFLVKAEKLLKELGNQEKLPVAFNKLGYIYLSTGLDSLALKSFNQALQTNQNNDLAAISESRLGIASVCLINHDLEAALNEINIAISESINARDRRTNILAIIKKAEIIFEMGDYPAAQILLEGVVDQIDGTGMERQKAEAFEMLSLNYYRLGEKDKAASIAIKSLELAKAISDLDLIQKNSFMLGQIMSEKGQYISASQMLLMSNRYKDSLKLKDSENILKNQILKSEIANSNQVALYEGKARKNLVFNKAGTEYKLQNLLVISIILLILLIGFFSIILLKGYKTNKKLYRDLLPNNNSENNSSELEKLAVLNNKIFSVISHDLRSPIISIKDSIDFLRQEGLDEETKQEALILSEELTEATLNLLDNLLGWAKNQKKKVEPKQVPVKVSDEIRQIETLYKASFNKKNITFKTDCSENQVALADNELINLALRNLISNAVKFTPRGGEINVKVEVIRTTIFVSVSDTGIGISKEDQHKILAADTFFTKNGTENESGSGIGLKLVKEFVRVMGGELRIDSSPGQGSTFTFSLPAYDVKKNPHSHESFFKHTIN
jgi:signal transduction histidine kinase/Tfp pilus assembly protein PilF